MPRRNAYLDGLLGSFDRMVDQSKAWRQGNLLEPPEVDAEQDDADDEPSLGSIEWQEWADQERWAAGGTKDLEDEHDGAEPEHEDYDGRADDEPSLGWTIDGVAADQSGADRELQEHPTVLPAAPRTANGVSVEDRGYGGRKVITGMTACQVDRVEPQLDRYGLISTDSVNTRGLL